MKKIGKSLLPESVSWAFVGLFASFAIIVGVGLMLLGLFIYGLVRPKHAWEIFVELKDNFQTRGSYK